MKSDGGDACSPAGDRRTAGLSATSTLYRTARQLEPYREASRALVVASPSSLAPRASPRTSLGHSPSSAPRTSPRTPVHRSARASSLAQLRREYDPVLRQRLLAAEKLAACHEEEQRALLASAATAFGTTVGAIVDILRAECAEADEAESALRAELTRARERAELADRRALSAEERARALALALGALGGVDGGACAHSVSAAARPADVEPCAGDSSIADRAARCQPSSAEEAQGNSSESPAAAEMGASAHPNVAAPGVACARDAPPACEPPSNG
ncbi:hypothetical protein KFE25_012536 [Diacronema lutheri]|uniref:Uncharacterized protein n=1 Tax=Diacronema lutheri TaxID=2081491 RepID=A0A8J6CF18_DIALT|nr:hypothetical protein KFE25_012536 [Diacronema lutheri]